ncbi:beta strand repeat-containing protein [Urbifossiella limnaea]|uniref:FG-GAP repeat protein n=1 Tax=Urbifossiella limnaea TaxID=2528023 RepID=A0A517XSS2_9BACT|nr:putative Ig domain-containing protein [Urbifossiella limnaea]QDU20543.1 FG-GAP repeat protein [Urbifossiella limnaea]
MPTTLRPIRVAKARSTGFRPELEHLGDRVLPAVTWQVQSDYFGTRDSVSQPRSLRSLALSGDDQHAYTGYIQGSSSAAIREVSAGVNAALIGNEPTPFGANPPYTSGLEGRVATTGFARGLAADDRGYVYAINTSNTNSFAQGWSIYSANLGTVPGNVVSSNTTASTLNGIDIVAIGGSYYAYVGWRNGLIERWNVTNPTIPTLDTSWGAPATPGKVNLKTIDADAYLNNLAVDADGTVFVAGGLQSTTSYGDALIKIPAAGAAVGDLSGVTSANVSGGANGSGGFAAMDVALFGGKAYVTQYLAANSTIGVFNTADLSSDGIITPPGATLAGPSGLVSTYNSDAALDSGFSGIDISADGRIFLAEQLYSFVPSSGSYTPPGGVAMTGTRIYFDRVLVSSALGVAPLVTSVSSATFTVGTAGTFTITSSGVPTADLSATGALPAGVTFTDNGDGTATLTGTPAAGTGGTYPLTITAANGVALDGTQAFTLTVNEAPTITSATATTFTAGTLGTFTVTTGPAFPTAVTISRTGTLPAGVTFTDNGDGTATLTGTPAAGTGGTYPITFTAANGIAPDATQAFTLTVNEAPTITSAAATTFTAGTAGTFTVTTGAAFPTAVTISQTGTLSAGVTFTDNGDGTATLAGTPAAGTGGTYALSFTAANGVAPDATQAFTLTVNEAPTFTSASAATFLVGTGGTFTVTTGTAFPAGVTISRTGTLPPGVTFTDNGDGTATLAGTPAAGAGGTYALSFTAANGVAPDATQAFTLTVNEAPTITSGAPPAELTVSAPASFTVTTSAFPAATYSLASGELPAGLALDPTTGVVSGTPTTVGRYEGVIRATNASGTADQPFSIAVRGGPDQSSVGQFAVSGGPSGANTVVPLNPDGSANGSAFSPFGSTPARAAVADVTGDGVPDYVVGSGPGRVATVVVIDGATRVTVATYLPFGDAFAGGTFVALGDVDGDGRADIAVSADLTGGPRVVVLSGATGAPLASFLGIDDDNFRGGARVALGDLNRDGLADVVVAAGPGGGPRVAVFDGATIRPTLTPTRLVGDFFVYEPQLTDGVYVAVGDVDGDGAGDLVTTPGVGGSPRVLVVSGAQLLFGPAAAIADPLTNFFAADSSGRLGARVVAKDLDGDDFADLVVSVPGVASRSVIGFRGADLAAGTATVLRDYSADFDPLLTNVFVG